MDVTTNYGIGSAVKNNITIPTALSVTETDLFVITSGTDLKYSQLTIYADVTLGGVANATFYYYYSFDNGTTWHPVSVYNPSTGEIVQRNVLVDGGTYVTGGVSRFADNIPFGACTQFKITGVAASGTPAFTLRVMGRNN